MYTLKVCRCIIFLIIELMHVFEWLLLFSLVVVVVILCIPPSTLFTVPPSSLSLIITLYNVFYFAAITMECHQFYGQDVLYTSSHINMDIYISGIWINMHTIFCDHIGNRKKTFFYFSYSHSK